MRPAVFGVVSRRAVVVAVVLTGVLTVGAVGTPPRGPASTESAVLDALPRCSSLSPCRTSMS